MNFMEALKNEFLESEFNVSVTENGALGYKTTGKKLLDFNFAVSSMRRWDEKTIESRFAEVCAEDLNLAVVWLFFSRDIRGKGMGERRIFRVCLKYLAINFPEKVVKVLKLVPEYGRWDDLFDLCDDSIPKTVQDELFSIIREQFRSDVFNLRNQKSISLMAKWLPSINSHSKKTRANAKRIVKGLGIKDRQYQTLCSRLRGYLNVVETKMSANEWGDIVYRDVPSRANLNYNSAFLRHDEYRRRKFLEKVEKGETKVNAGALFPHDIVHKYGFGRMGSIWGAREAEVDDNLEAAWKALPDYVKGCGGSTLVVADGSGSMTSNVDPRSGLTAIEVCNALAIYFAERASGAFKNTYITFSSSPSIVNIGNGTLLSKLRIALAHDECSNTNIEATFDLILETAIKNRMKQEDLPKNILIITDGEFDAMTGPCSWGFYNREKDFKAPNNALFNDIKRRFKEAGYDMPRLIFWNVASRTNTIPLKENALGVALVSGFSPAIANMVLSNKLDPWVCLLEALADKRYEPVVKALSE